MQEPGRLFFKFSRVWLHRAGAEPEGLGRVSSERIPDLDVLAEREFSPHTGDRSPSSAALGAGSGRLGEAGGGWGASPALPLMLET